MARSPAHHPDVKAEALRRFANGQPAARIAEDLQVALPTVYSWVQRSRHAPADRQAKGWAESRLQPIEQALKIAPPITEPSAEHIGRKLYDTAIATLDALAARAVATADPEWIKAQSADALAELDAVQGNWVIRVISAFRAEAPAVAEALEAEAVDAPGEPEVHRNGAVDSAG